MSGEINILNKDLQNLSGEVWRDIPNYDNYQISNYGRVKSYVKNIPRILKKTISSGKHKLQLYIKPGVFKTEQVGCIVATVFIREPKENEILFYKDGNTLNDICSNLGWKTKSESVREARNRHKYSHKGESNGMAKLNAEKVLNIRTELYYGGSVKELSNTYGVSPCTIKRIRDGKTWVSKQ